MNDCTEARPSLGVYVMGAIDPAERSRLEAHLETCPSCRDELAGLAGMPALLGRVNEAQISQVAGPPPELLDALLARAAERRRGSWAGRFRWAPAALVACAFLLVGGLAGGLVTEWTDRGASPAATPTATPPGERLVANNAGNQVRAELVLYPKRWGTKVELHLTGVPMGGHCRWFAVSRDGERDMLGSWYVAYDKGYGVYESSTMFQREQLSSFQVVTLDGQTIISIRA